MDTDTPVDPDATEEEQEQTAEETPADPVETVATPIPVTAARGARRTITTHPYAGIGIREISKMISAAHATGDVQLARRVNTIMASPGARTGTIEAALADIKLVGTDNVGVMQRPGYQAELVDIVSHGSPLVNALRQGDLQRGDYPNVTFNAWTKLPDVALQATEKSAINSTAVAIAPTSVPVNTWATGNDISQQILDFGSPSFVEDYIRAAGVDYAATIEAYATTALLTAATAATTLAGDSFAQILQKLFTALDPTKVPPGRMFLAVSWDAGVGLISVTDANKPAFWSGDLNFSSVLPDVNVGGIQVIVDPYLPAKTYLLGMSQAATWYDLPGTPFSLRAVNVGLLGLDVAVYGYGAIGIQYPKAFTKTTQP